jgi:hypothetical protein
VTTGPNAPSDAPGLPKANLQAAAGPTAPVTALQSTSATHYTRFDLWLHRLTVLMLVFVCAVVGVLLVILPWRPEWTDNRLLMDYPALRTFVSNGFVRGLCSGLGILDIGIGFWEAVHYHEQKPS